MEKTKNHGIPESARDMMKHFGKDAFKLNAHEKKFIQEQGFGTEYLFMETREDRRSQRGWCSHCRKWLPLPVYVPERLAHNEKVRCPKCGCDLTVKHAWRMSKKMYDEALAYLYRPSVINPEVVTARAVVVKRWWGPYCLTGSPLDMKPDVYFDSFYVFEPGAGGKMLKPNNNGRIYWVEQFHDKVRYEQARKPFRRDSVYERNCYGWDRRGLLSITADTEGAFRAAENSPLRYGMEEYEPFSNDHFLQFWHWAARYSSLEKLVKIGLAELVANKIQIGGGGNCVNWRGKDLASILRGRLTKEDKAFIRGNGDLIDTTVLQIWQFFDGKLSIEEAVQKERKANWSWKCQMGNWLRIKRRIGKSEKVMRYIEKKDDRTPDLYADYLAECAKLGYDLTDKAVLFPKDLRTAHAHTMAQIRYKENLDLETDYAEKRRPAMRKKYEWAAMGMIVVVPEHVSDLIAEGEKQHNCVGGYMERVAKGQTDVVFIRKDEAPEKSYITMEIHDGKIIQARTKDNGPLDKLGKKFVEAFRRAKLEKKKKARKTA